MPGLKLSIAASICSKPFKLARTSVGSTTATATATIRPYTRRKLTVCNGAWWWRMPSVPLVLPAHNTSSSGKKRVGLDSFGAQQCFSFSSSKLSSSSEDKQTVPGSGCGSGSVADVGSENKDNAWKHKMQQHQSSPLLTLPTVLTLARVAAVPLLIGTFYADSWWATTATTTIFVAASITDWLDGYLARKMNLGSIFGAFLDPVADKLIVATTLVLLCSEPLEVAILGQVPWLLTVPSIAIIGREITMSAVREWAASQNGKLLEAVAVNNLGKWKTATQMTALTILLATRDSSLGAPTILVASGVISLYVSAGLAIMSLVVYMRNIQKVLLK